MIKIKIITATKVKPEKETIQSSIPFTLLDKTYLFPLYNSVVYIYRPITNVPGFATVLRDSLSKTLVHFYPLAGRSRSDGDGNITEIDCNDEGVPFVEAETDSELKDLGDLAPSSEISALLPIIDRSSKDVSSYPMLAVQVTYFRCGGVSLGVSGEHHGMDGSAAFHLTKSWSEIARGLEISTKPFLDRSLISPRDPPQPKFDHPEFENRKVSPTAANDDDDVKVSVFIMTRDQLARLKAIASTKEKSDGDERCYSTFEALAGHIWKCVTKAREIGSEEETRIMFSLNSRYGNRWKPELPPGFFGNAVFRANNVALVRDLVSNPLSYAAAKVHEASARMDNEYLRSVIDHLALMPDDDPTAVRKGNYLYYSPNFLITSWAKMGVNDADFGWGPPIYAGPGRFKYEKAFIFSSDDDDGGLSVVISLRPLHMEVFEKLFYEF